MRTSRHRSSELGESPPTASRRARYLITVRGASSASCSGWPDASAVENGDGTTTVDVFFDQAGLRGILCHLWDLNATLVDVTWAPASPEPEGSIEDD